MITRMLNVLLISVAVFVFLLGFVAVFGCGGSEPYTWGDASDELGQAYCERLIQCGAPTKQDLCEASLYYQFCELEETCDVELDDPENLVGVCVDDFENADCVALVYYGFVPSSCVEARQLAPDPTE